MKINKRVYLQKVLCKIRQFEVIEIYLIYKIMSKICKKHDLNYTLLGKVVMHRWGIIKKNIMKNMIKSKMVKNSDI